MREQLELIPLMSASSSAAHHLPHSLGSAIASQRHKLLLVLAGNYTQEKETCQQQQGIKRLIQSSVYDHRLVFQPLP